ncbi:DUF7740 domain-containing protein [Pseudomonas sp. CFBP 13727]|uniref:DUF7740 domain-containing protein n=1 Tax=Pseudomonas sp. CFBP 13727 TaxID=2775295 RepID=UPI001FD45FF4|nr:hypothetical protein [Pseudomonas sp. CFBP 13727]
MTLSDVILILLLAERIPSSDEAIRRSAMNVVKKLPRSKRDIIFQIVRAKSPRYLIQHIAANLDD